MGREGQSPQNSPERIRSLMALNDFLPRLGPGMPEKFGTLCSHCLKVVVNRISAFDRETARGSCHCRSQGFCRVQVPRLLEDQSMAAATEAGHECGNVTHSSEDRAAKLRELILLIFPRPFSVGCRWPAPCVLCAFASWHVPGPCSRKNLNLSKLKPRKS